MRRDTHISNGGGGVPFAQNLLFHAPLTTDGRDAVGAKTPAVTGTVSYSQDGAYFGGTQYLKYAFSKNEMLSSKTMFLRVKVTAQRNPYDYFATLGYSTGSVNYYRMAPYTTSPMKLSATLSWGSGATSFDSQVGANLQTDTWYDIAIVMDTNKQTFYLNGTDIWHRSNSDTWNNWGQSSGTLNIGTNAGANAANRSFYGYIKDVRIYDRALTASEVAQL